MTPHELDVLTGVVRAVAAGVLLAFALVGVALAVDAHRRGLDRLARYDAHHPRHADDRARH